MINSLELCVALVRKHTDFKPQIALILGSGLGDFADNIEKVFEVDFKKLPDFPVSTAPNHKGKLIFGFCEGVPVVIMQGRVHLYEGYTPEQVAFPIKFLKKLGAEYLLLTNAAGGINTGYKAGDIMLISDHISSFVPSALIGENDDAVGPRFPDMTCVYDCEMRDIARKVSKEIGLDLKEGIYLQVTGPQYETPAEINAYRILGADAVGMSTAIEATVARYCGMKVCGISCITNLAAGMTDKILSHEEVEKTAKICSDNFNELLIGIIKKNLA